MLLVYRKKKKGRLSIEKVFHPLEDFTEKVELPFELDSFINSIKLIKFLWTIKSNTIHVTGDVHYVIFLLFWKKSILSVHDLIKYEEKKGVNKLIYGIIWFWLPLKAANYVTVVSPYTKKQLQKHFKVDSMKVRVINNYFIPLVKNTSKVDINANDRNNILVVGTKKRKNIINLIKAINDIEDVKLTIVGKVPKNEENLLIKNEIIYDSYFNLTEIELSKVYNEADILFFASTKEGFGLPILEAQSIGLPVITSNTTAMPFVAGKGALIVDPYNIEEIKNAVLTLHNKIIRDEIIVEGYNNIKRFNKNDFINNYLQLYKSIE